MEPPRIPGMRRRPGLIAIIGVALSSVASADVTDDLTDLAARIDYGYYAREASIVEGARDALAELTGNHPLLDYFRGYAALRLAQVDGPQTRRGERGVEDCLRFGTAAAEHESAGAEAWVLVAACSAMAADASPLLAVRHQRRYEHAIGRARAADPENPRLLLIEALGVEAEQDSAATRSPRMAMLEEALAAFDLWPKPFDLPNWGEAETLAELGQAHLNRGDARAARDYIERALLIAPDYEQALALQRRLRGAR